LVTPVACLCLQVLVDQLREKCLEERLDLAGPAAAAAAAAAGGSSSSSSSAYSSLTTSPDDWRLDEHKPCSGERLLLMFDRYGWQLSVQSIWLLVLDVGLAVLDSPCMNV
jgi:hypothetical protein